MVKEYDEVMVQELKETFDMFDKDKDGYLDLAEFRKTLRSSGLNPSQEDFDRMKNLADVEKRVSFKQLLTIVQAEVRKMDREEDMLRALYVFDETNSGYIDGKILKNCLQTMGEKIDDKEFVEFAKLASPDLKNRIDYRKLVKLLFQMPI